MNNLSWALGSLLEDPQVLAIVDQTRASELKHAVEMLMWVIEKSGGQEYKESLLKRMLQPFMKPPQLNNFHEDPKPYDNSKRMHMLIQILTEYKPMAPHLLYKEVCMIELTGEVGCTDGQYTHPPEGLPPQHPDRVVPNTKFRQTRVREWVASPEDQPGLKKARLHKVEYGQGHNSGIIRSSSAWDLAVVMQDLLTKSTENNSPNKKLMVMVVWNINNYEELGEGDLEKALDAIDYIGNVLRPRVLSLIWIGPGHAGGFLNKKELAQGCKEKCDNIAE